MKIHEPLYHVIISSLTCDDKFTVAEFAFVFNCDPTFVSSRVCGPGRVEFIHDRVLCGGVGEDGKGVPRQLESMGQVWDVVMTDADLAAKGHRGPALNCVAG